MSIELPCPYCGNEELDTTTKEPLAMTLNDGDMVRCGNEGCPICDVLMTVKTWNRRFAYLDENDDKVFAGDKVIALGGNTCLVKLVPALVPLSDTGKDVGFDPRTAFGTIELIQETANGPR